MSDIQSHQFDPEEPLQDEDDSDCFEESGIIEESGVYELVSTRTICTSGPGDVRVLDISPSGA